jgi:hypothetical protein
MPSRSLKSAVREIARVDPANAKKVQSAVTRLTAALDEQVAARVEVPIAKAFRRLNASDRAVGSWWPRCRAAGAAVGGPAAGAGAALLRGATPPEVLRRGEGPCASRACWPMKLGDAAAA